MEDIQLVINIPKDEYNIIKKSNAPMTWAEHLIANGTPLPKGHGDLIDRNALRESMNGACMGVMAGSDDYDAPLKTLDSATAVIEADRREE